MENTRQTTSVILMVRPTHFGFNEQTASNNAFQVNDARLTPEEISQRAVKEFDTFVKTLRSVGVEIIVVEDTDQPIKYDAVFPNNWVTFHEDGTVITYPMFAENRRLERREDIIERLSQQYDFKQRIHLEPTENQGKFLEGTGSMILDRVHKIVYACLSPRTDAAVLQDFCNKAGYTPVIFHSVDETGQAIYHTNVMMALGENLAVICLDTIKDAEERKAVENSLKTTGKTIIPISLKQMNAFAGNMLQVRNKWGDTLLVMSQQALDSLTPEQVKRINNHTNIVCSPLSVIEKYGGGSARCMMAEVFVPDER